MLLLAGLLLSIGAGAAAICVWAHLRLIDAHARAATPAGDIGQYRPMLRLLADEEIDPASDVATRDEFRARRRQLFREYLHSLTREYGCLLARVRLAMVQSGVDRPDLAKELGRRRVSFAVALCRIEFRLQLHALGIGPDGLPGVVDAINVLQRQVGALADFTAWGS